MALRIYVEAEGGGKVEGGPGIKKQIFVKKTTSAYIYSTLHCVFDIVSHIWETVSQDLIKALFLNLFYLCTAHDHRFLKIISNRLSQTTIFLVKGTQA
jgi:hypothetical protein